MVRETAASGYTTINGMDIELPDLLTDLLDKTQLTRRSLVEIITQSRRLNNFKRNPQQFIELAAEAIIRTKRLALVDGIRYQLFGDDHYYAQELIEQEELTGYLKNPLETQKPEYQHVVYDSADVERRFAEDLETNEDVKVYAKLPGWFKVPTPLGTNNPDWAVVIEIEGEASKTSLVWVSRGLSSLRRNLYTLLIALSKHYTKAKVSNHPVHSLNKDVAECPYEIVKN